MQRLNKSMNMGQSQKPSMITKPVVQKALKKKDQFFRLDTTDDDELNERVLNQTQIFQDFDMTASNRLSQEIKALE